MLENIDWFGINSEYFTGKIYDAIGGLTLKCLKFKDDIKSTNDKKYKFEGKTLGVKSDFEYELHQNIVKDNILHNLKFSHNWAKEINFKDATKPRALESIFVPVDFYLTPKRTHFDTELEPKIPLNKVNFTKKNSLILGGPGAGKTTLMKKIFQDEISKKEFLFPLVIQFRYEENIDNETTIFDLLQRVFGFELKVHSDCERIIERYEALLREDNDKDEDIELLNNEYNNKDEELELNYNYKSSQNELDELQVEYKFSKEVYKRLIDKYQNFRERLIVELLDELNILLIFDGFDELPNQKIKDTLIKSIEKLSLSIDKTRFILTSRTGEFDNQIPNSQTFEIADLNNVQIKQFISNWFRSSTKTSKMLQELSNSPFRDTTLRPLNLAHLCALFERYGEVPQKPKTVYKKIVNLLIEEWDEQRNIKRVSKYSKFTIDRKSEFLSNLSFLLTSKFAKAFFTKSLLQTSYNQICENYNLPVGEVDIVVNELESFTGLFVKSGYDKFEFSHKSIQEYLTAEYITRSNLLLFRKQFLIEMPNELAIAISLSSNPSLFFASVIFDFKHNTVNYSFAFPFLERLSLEKPDFENTYLFALSICYFYDTFKVNEKDVSRVEDFKKLLISSIPSQTLKKSFELLSQAYWKVETNKVSKVGGLGLSFDLDEMKVPGSYSNFIILDEFTSKLYNGEI